VNTADAIVSTLIDNSLSAMSESMIVFPWRSDYCVLVSKDQNTKLIVIVDDDESVQTALQELIEADGLSARCFGSAEEFLQSGLQRKTPCLITDIRMPGMSGMSTAIVTGGRCPANRRGTATTTGPVLSEGV
jgi:PleD family two-component response regulator